MDLYSAYGLTIRSSLPLPELPSGQGAPDVTVRYGACKSDLSENNSKGYGQALDEFGTRLFWKEAGHFLVSRGREIVVDPAPDADEQFIRAALLGPVLAALLHQRGYMVLHASGVVMEDRAVAFLADSGEGKSTTAAAFHRAGCPVISDDLIAIRFSESGPEVLSGFPRLNLLPDALCGLGVDPLNLPRIYSGTEKRRHIVRPPGSNLPLRLHALYLLATADSVALKALEAPAAMKALAEMTFASSLLGPEGLRAHFFQCALLARMGVVHRLNRPRDLARIDELVQAVKDDVRISH